MKKLYAIGTGPGDKKYLTLWAVEALKEAHVIFAPDNKGKNMALDTVRDFIDGKRIVYLDFPMGFVTEDHYKKAFEIIQKEIPDGKSGAFVTIGDATVYSTLVNTIHYARDMEIEFVPGVPSFLAAANRLSVPLVKKGEAFVLCEDVNENILSAADAVAILKTFKNPSKEEIIKKLKAHGFDYKYISNISAANERVAETDQEILAEENYLSLIIGRREKNDR